MDACLTSDLRPQTSEIVIALALANAQRYQFKPTGTIRLVTPMPRAARLRARGRVLVG